MLGINCTDIRLCQVDHHGSVFDFNYLIYCFLDRFIVKIIVGMQDVIGLEGNIGWNEIYIIDFLKA